MSTRPKQCTVYIPPVYPAVLPTRCTRRVSRAGRCANHLKEWLAEKAERREAAEKRRAEAKPSDLNARGRLPLPVAERVVPADRPRTSREERAKAAKEKHERQLAACYPKRRTPERKRAA